MSGPAGGQCTCALSGNVCLSRCGRRPLRTTTYHTTYHPPLLPATLWTTPAAAYYHYCEATPCDRLLQLSTTVTVNTTACYRHLLLRVPTTIACYCHRNHTPPPATTTLPVITATAPATCCYCYCCYDSYYCYYLLFPTASLYDDCHCRRHNHSHLLGCSTHTHMRARALYPSSLLSLPPSLSTPTDTHRTQHTY